MVDERGAAPVVANLLLVAVGLVLVTVLAVAAFGLVGDQAVAPAGAFTVEDSSGTVSVVYTHGDAIDPSAVYVKGTDPDGDVTFGRWDTLGGTTSDGSVTAGSELTLPAADRDETIRVVWAPRSSEESAVLTEWEGTADLGRTISGCTEITESDTYRLVSDVSQSPNTTCLDVQADNVTILGQGHTIDSAGTGSAGVQVAAGTSDVTVRDLTVTDWDTGIEYQGGDGGEITGVTVDSPTGNQGVLLTGVEDVAVSNVDISGTNLGVSMSGTTDARVTDSNVSEAANFGVAVYNGASATQVETTNVSGVLYGVFVYGATGTTITDSTAMQNGYSGILDFQSTRTKIVDVTVADSANYGVWGYYSTDTIVRDSTVSGSSSDGIYFLFTDDTTVDRTVVDDNGGSGVYIYSSTGNIVTDSTLTNNGQYGACARPQNDNEFRNNGNTVSGNGQGDYCSP